jgi:hypothetical protein
MLETFETPVVVAAVNGCQAWLQLCGDNVSGRDCTNSLPDLLMNFGEKPSHAIRTTVYGNPQRHDYQVELPRSRFNHSMLTILEPSDLDVRVLRIGVDITISPALSCTDRDTKPG